MRADFATNLATLVHAATRAGLAAVSYCKDVPEGTINLSTVLDPEGTPIASAAEGTTHSIMRLIGALADDGDDCLISVKLFQ